MGNSLPTTVWRARPLFVRLVRVAPNRFFWNGESHAPGSRSQCWGSRWVEGGVFSVERAAPGGVGCGRVHVEKGPRVARHFHIGCWTGATNIQQNSTRVPVERDTRKARDRYVFSPFGLLASYATLSQIFFLFLSFLSLRFHVFCGNGDYNDSDKSLCIPFADFWQLCTSTESSNSEQPGARGAEKAAVQQPGASEVHAQAPLRSSWARARSAAASSCGQAQRTREEQGEAGQHGLPDSSTARAQRRGQQEDEQSGDAALGCGVHPRAPAAFGRARRRVCCLPVRSPVSHGLERMLCWPRVPPLRLLLWRERIRAPKLGGAGTAGLCRLVRRVLVTGEYVSLDQITRF